MPLTPDSSGLRMAAAAAFLAACATFLTPVPIMTTSDARGLTAVDGIRVGHDAMPGRPAGCTVILA